MEHIIDLSDAELYAAEACIENGNADPALLEMVEKAHAVREFIERYDNAEGF